MKSRVIELQEKANQLLELAIAMDKRIKVAEEFEQAYKTELPLLSDRWNNRADTRKRGSRRLWNAYLQVLTEIKLEL